MAAAKLWIILGSTSDLPSFEDAENLLGTLQIPYEIKILSAHRTPALLKKTLKTCPPGVEVIIGGAGGAAHLAGVIASHTLRPVIGVPMPSKLDGVDSFVSTSQMPAGIPVATMSIGKAGATNAVLFAAEIMALRHKNILTRLKKHRTGMAFKVKKANDSMKQRKRK